MPERIVIAENEDREGDPGTGATVSPAFDTLSRRPRPFAPAWRATVELASLLLVALLPLCAVADGDSTPPVNRCIECHADERQGFSTPHAFGADACTSCHAGDGRSGIEDEAHDGLVAFPGNLDNAERACGACHAGRVDGVRNNLMHTGRGIVSTTRRLIDGAGAPGDDDSFQSLGHGIADSMLRKLCASCHLGQDRTEHRIDVTRDRGGGCLACHVDAYPDDAHPALTAKVSDARCFGCHSRSGRISLSYAGLAETLERSDDTLFLADGRYVERHEADRHYLAGMSCIDCHTSVGLMGHAGDASHQRQAVDIECADCHDNRQRRVRLDEWPGELAGMARHVPFEADDDTLFLATRRNATPLWNVELRPDGAWLHTKLTGRVLKISAPASTAAVHDDRHDRLTCAACHSQWQPQCFGCHASFDPDDSQWDHVDKAVTPGRWHERRDDFRAGPGALGVNEEGRIEPFVPGMIMTLDHPDLDDEKFMRIFAPLSPHTSGPSRSCESCHRSSVAVGLGEGRITTDDGRLEFRPSQEALPDGLPADAWTNLDGTLNGDAPRPGQRPFDRDEIARILAAPLGATGGGPGDR